MAFRGISKAIDFRKLGTCLYCVGLATRLALVCLSGYAVTSILFISPLFATLFLIGAAAFIALLLAHGIAYLWLRKKAASRSTPE